LVCVLKIVFEPQISNDNVAEMFFNNNLAEIFVLSRRSVGDQHCSCISYDVAANQWSVITSVPLPSLQSAGFHFVSQLLDQIDVGLQMAATDIRSLAARFPLHGVLYTVHMYILLKPLPSTFFVL